MQFWTISYPWRKRHLRVSFASFYSILVSVFFFSSSRLNNVTFGLQLVYSILTHISMIFDLGNLGLGPNIRYISLISNLYSPVGPFSLQLVHIWTLSLTFSMFSFANEQSFNPTWTRLFSASKNRGNQMHYHLLSLLSTLLSTL